MEESEEKRNQQKEEGMPTKEKAIVKILSVLICLSIVLLGTYASLIFIIRGATGKDAIHAFVKEVNNSSINIDFLTDIDINIEPEDSFIGDISDYTEDYLAEENVRKLLKEDFVWDFVEGKLNDYVEDFFEGTGKGVIRKEELEQLLDENKEKICEFLGIEDLKVEIYGEWAYVGKEQLWNEAREALLEGTEEISEQTALSNYQKEYPDIFRLIQKFLSYQMLKRVLGLVLLLMVLMLLLQRRKSKWFGYMAGSILVVGVLEALLYAMTRFLGNELRSMIDSEQQFVLKLLEPLKKTNMELMIACFIAGVICILGYMAAKMIGSRKEML